MRRVTVNKIIPFSCVDGPGNRCAIFFQGCQFRCSYCHNPETINACTHCSACVPGCPAEALSVRDGLVVWDRELCIDCDQCVRVCPSLSTPKTRTYSVSELVDEIRDTAPFISGITCSGGEATLHAPFLAELFERVHELLALSCFIDTNGGVDLSRRESLVAATDQFMLDVKAFRDDDHRRVTGQSNATVLRNLRFLLEREKLHEVRTVIVPGLDNERTVREVARIIGAACPYKLSPYHTHGVRPEGLGRHGDVGIDRESMYRFREIAIAEGANPVLVP